MYECGGWGGGGGSVSGGCGWDECRLGGGWCRGEGGGGVLELWTGFFWGDSAIIHRMSA